MSKIIIANNANEKSSTEGSQAGPKGPDVPKSAEVPKGQPEGPEGHVVDDFTLLLMVTRSINRIAQGINSISTPIKELHDQVQPGDSADPIILSKAFGRTIKEYGEIAVSVAGSLEQIRDCLIKRMAVAKDKQ